MLKLEQASSTDMIPDMDLIVKSTRKTNELKTVTFEALLLSITQIECFWDKSYYEVEQSI